jgi:hypothetical protein
MLKGSLDDFTLADVFRLLSLAKRSGKLDVTRSAGEGRVFFRDGEIYYAHSSMTKEPLGKKLIRARVVTETQLMKALDQSAAGEGRVGEILVASGVATTEQLQTAVKQQIEDAVFEMLRWDRGEFSWEPNVEADVEVPIAVSVENLIMESSRRLEELELIQRKIPGEETIPGMAPSPPEGAVEINITPEEWRILVLIDGRRTVADISAGSGWDEFTTMRTLYGLVSAGLVDVLGPPSETIAERTEAVPGFDGAAVDQPAEPAAITLEPDAPEPVEAPAQISEFPSFAAPPEEREQPAAQPDEPAQPEGSERAEFVPQPEVPDVPQPVAAAEEISMAEGRPESTGEPFLSDLLRTDPEGEAGIGVVPEPGPEPGSELRPTPEPEPVAAAAEEPAEPTAEESLQLEIDKAEMARELSGLFRDDRPAYRPLIPGESEEDGKPPAPPKAPPVRKRVEDDEQVTKGLISRLIDGVKGL